MSALAYEIIFIDYEGNKVRATVTKNLIPFFINTFKEGSFFDLFNFGVVPCDDKVMIVNHPWKIMMYRTTNVVRCEPFELQADGFNTVPFVDLNEWRINTSQVFDVVGRLVEMNPLRVKREKADIVSSVHCGLIMRPSFLILCPNTEIAMSQLMSLFTTAKFVTGKPEGILLRIVRLEYEGSQFISTNTTDVGTSIIAIMKTVNIGESKMITGDQLAIRKETGRRLGMEKNMYPSSSLLGQNKDSAILDIPIEELIEEAGGFA
ncbi:uncharacterized protein [Rutidosis leptorrhynchoides]|uniref:uncharacterized protein isoform X2 n=1 Tax=Rutidosis leptorrhynchoides TaxID=125765 RepID=UPI003A9A1351